ncbi:hypothetical protein [Thalassobellus suaedae]|uniref:Uncharacterized protein n=1 Tax=Thalassobellus suaedae TaxID=3074124 RepID=A0ABY9XZ01_9FLAO|nr:hypothetical protein RHP49_09470 [Flavobacteriaceae bacterium HL-DH10]
MSKKSLHKFYLDLIPNLITELFFFLPEKEIRVDIIEKLDFLKNQNVLNKVYVFDHYVGPMEYKKGRSNKNIFLKSGKLEQNIFRLVEKKSEVKKQEFYYVLNKYFELVETLFYMTNWMNTNLVQVVKKDDGIIGLFHVQFLNFKKHFEELVRNFYPNREAIPKGNFNAHEIIETYFPDITKSFKPATNSVIVPNFKARTKSVELNHIENTTTPPLPPPLQKADKKDKKQLVTEEEVEKLLLETFFNIK